MSDWWVSWERTHVGFILHAAKVKGKKEILTLLAIITWYSLGKSSSGELDGMNYQRRKLKLET